MTSLTGTVVATRILPPAPRAGRSISPPPGELEELIHSARARATDVDRESHRRSRYLGSIQADIDLIASAPSMRSVRQMADGPCPAGAGPAFVFLDTGRPDGNVKSFSILITGNGGSRGLTFVSGTTQSEMIAALNTLKLFLGVSAAQSVLNPARISLGSFEAGADGFVRVEQLMGSDLIFSAPLGGQPLDDLKDYGSNPIVLWATGQP